MKKKKIVILMAALGLSMALAGCGKTVETSGKATEQTESSKAGKSGKSENSSEEKSNVKAEKDEKTEEEKNKEKEKSEEKEEVKESSKKEIIPVEEGDIPIDEAHFPDEVFRNWVLENCDTDKDGILSWEERGDRDRWEIEVDGEKIKELTGIRYFYNMEELYCQGNQLTKLDVSGLTALTTICCYINQLTELNVSGCTALEYLRCEENQLTELDVSGCTALKSLNCRYNLLTEIDVRGLTSLDTNSTEFMIDENVKVITD